MKNIIVMLLKARKSGNNTNTAKAVLNAMCRNEIQAMKDGCGSK